MPGGLLDPAVQVRMVATAAVVIAVSWSVGAFGPLIGGALAGLPMVLAPAFFFLVQQNPAAFVATTATFTLLALSATQLFLLAYLLAARHAGPLGALGRAVAAWMAAALVCRLLPPSPTLGVALFVATTVLCLRASRHAARSAPKPSQAPAPLVLLLRGVLAGAMVAATTLTADWLGAAGAGVLLAFPVGYTVIATTVHEKLGADTVISTLRSALVGGSSLAVFCLLLSVLTGPLAAWQALAVAGVGAVSFTCLLLYFRRVRLVDRSDASSPLSR